jgi:hypothetical protein
MVDPDNARPVEVRVVVNWMSDHGYRDRVPRRDASQPARMTWYFVKDGRRKLAVPAINGLIERPKFEWLKLEVEKNEQEKRDNH